jgi:phage terminase Nu1 subunit (DNA packaging protein)
MFPSIKSQSRYTIEAFMCQSVQVSLHDKFYPSQYATRCADATKRAVSQTLASTQTCTFRVENVFNAQVNYEHTLSRAIHHIPNVSLQQKRKYPAVTYRNTDFTLCEIH